MHDNKYIFILFTQIIAQHILEDVIAYQSYYGIRLARKYIPKLLDSNNNR